MKGRNFIENVVVKYKWIYNIKGQCAIPVIIRHGNRVSFKPMTRLFSWFPVD